MLYLDHCATTPPYDEVIETMTQIMKQYYGNPSSLHRLGVEAERLLNKAREVIANQLAAHNEEIIFTSGGTESNNLAVRGIAKAYRNRGNHLITTAIEHASVYECCKQLEKEGYRVTFLPADHTGAIRLEQLQQVIDRDTILVSIMHVNNETGRIQPIEEIGQLLRQYPRIAFHVDAVQGIGKFKYNMRESRIDLLSGSAHKFGGPRGTGFLYRRKGLQLEPLLVGGGQETGVRSGTEDVPAIAGMAKALRMCYDKQNEHTSHLYKLRQNLVERISAMNGIFMNGSDKMNEMAPHIIHFSIPGYKPETIVHALEQREIFISTKSACDSSEERPSRVLQAMGLDHSLAISGLRVSLTAENSLEDIHFFADTLASVLKQIPRQGGATG